EIYGPYGRFERRQAPREAWIAGGVGISPFVAWLGDPAASSFRNVTLFYFFTPGREFPSAETIRALAEARGAAFVPVSDFSSAELAERLGRIARDGGGPDVAVSFCTDLAGCSTRSVQPCAAPAYRRSTFATNTSSSAERGAAHCAR